MNPSIPTGSSDAAPSRFGDGGIVQFVDLHAAAHVWEVAPGVVVHGYGFNGQVPGPVIEAAVADRLLVQFSNGTDVPTTLVWEAPSGPATPMRTTTPHWVVPGGSHLFERTLTQPGAFLYRAISPSRPANTLVALYGVLLVKGPAEPAVDQERVLVVHQAEPIIGRRAVAQQSALAPGRPNSPLLLINGARHALIEIRAGSQERWRILNAAADVQLRLSLSRHPEQGDGDDRHVSSQDPRLPRQPRPAAGLDLQIGPFARDDQITLCAVTAGDDTATTDHVLLTCHVV